MNINKRWSAGKLSDFGDDLSGRHLLAFRDIDRGNRAGNRRGVHMFHLHRLQRHHRLAGLDGGDAYVTGATAVSVDVSTSLDAALPVYLVLVVGLALVLLVLVFRSLLVPLVGVLGFLLTIGSSLGATVAVMCVPARSDRTVKEVAARSPGGCRRR